MTLNELYKHADYIVFDPCAGSGAHCYVAKRLDRKYIGVELDKGYFDVAVERIGG